MLGLRILARTSGYCWVMARAYVLSHLVARWLDLRRQKVLTGKYGVTLLIEVAWSKPKSREARNVTFKGWAVKNGVLI